MRLVVPRRGGKKGLLDLAARVSNIGIMPDNSQGASGTVIVLSAEDGAEDTIKPRLEAAGANENRLVDLSHVTIRGEERPVEIPADLPLIARKIKEHDARLLIIDPLMAFLCGADANKDQEVRRVLYKLSKIAETWLRTASWVGLSSASNAALLMIVRFFGIHACTS